MSNRLSKPRNRGRVKVEVGSKANASTPRPIVLQLYDDTITANGLPIRRTYTTIPSDSDTDTRIIRAQQNQTNKKGKNNNGKERLQQEEE